MQQNYNKRCKLDEKSLFLKLQFSCERNDVSIRHIQNKFHVKRKEQKH